MDYSRMSSDAGGYSTTYSRRALQSEVKKKNKGGIKSFIMNCLFSSSKSKPLNQGFLNEQKNIVDEWNQKDKMSEVNIFGQKSDFTPSQYIQIK